MPPVRPLAGRPLTVLLTMLVSTGALSTAIYTPALPDITLDLASDTARAKLTLTLFLAAFAVAQLVYGPISDAFGRRPALIGGLALFLAGCLACAVAPTMETLIAARFLQAVGACSGPVIARAVVRDLFGPAEAQRVMATLSAAISIGPALAPTLGGAIHGLFGWRSLFLLLAVLAAALFTAVLWRLQETNRSPSPAAVRPFAIAATYRLLLLDRRYMLHAGGVALLFGALFGFITGAPFLFITELGVSPQLYGLVTLVNTAGYLGGTLIIGRLGPGLGNARSILLGGMVASLGGSALLVLASAGLLGAAPVLGSSLVIHVGIGLAVPAGMAGAIAGYPTIAGSASALLGFLQMATGALASLLVSALNDAAHLAMMAVICGCCLGTLAAGLALWRRDRHRLTASARTEKTPGSDD